MIDVAAAVFIANKLGADPLWLFFIAPPSNTKTEILMCFQDYPQAVFISTLTAKTLVSGFKSEKVENPSLLPKLSDKLLVLKDFTSVLSMRQEPRAEVIAQLREAYDGQYSKAFGNGVVFNWKGKFGLLGACTNEYDAHHGVISQMGERFLLYRSRNQDNSAMGMRAHEMVGREDEIRAEVRAAFQKFIGQFENMKAVQFREKGSIINVIVAMACFVAVCRTPVKRDYRGDVTSVLFQTEGSGRITKQLKQLGYGLAVAYGKDIIDEEVLSVLRKVAGDLISPMRLMIIRHLWARKAFESAGGWLRTTEIAENLSLPASTTKNVCEDLMVVGGVRRDLLEPDRTEGGRPGYRWQLTDKLSGWIADSEVFKGPKCKRIK
jgi:hypothetical protein